MTADAGSVDRQGILDILRKEMALHEELLSVSRREQELLVHGRVDELESVVGELERVVEQIKGIAEVRMQMLANAASSRSAESPECMRVIFDIVGVIGEIERVNRANRFLVENSLEYLTFLGNFTDSAGGPGTYRVPGSVAIAGPGTSVGSVATAAATASVGSAAAGRGAADQAGQDHEAIDDDLEIADKGLVN